MYFDRFPRCGVDNVGIIKVLILRHNHPINQIIQIVGSQIDSGDKEDQDG